MGKRTTKNNEQLQYYSALGFFKQARISAETINFNSGLEGFELSPVSATCYTFAAELLLKLLHNISPSKPSKSGHKLEELFDYLPLETQNKIERNYNSKKLKTNSKEKLKAIKFSYNTSLNNNSDREDKNDIANLNIKELLRLHNDSFVNWRYSYEVKNYTYSIEFNFKLIDDFVESLIETIENELK
ncbi:hypothetical protein [Dokdonia sp. Asnod3-C12]|uniref:hypothetical protein n=1 Tax=Dokdonia sp. Asnod3-C12 TaxID=3160575 RepID=UPI0038657965